MILTEEQLKEFSKVHDHAYGWTSNDDGVLVGLVAGDMGYDLTEITLNDLFETACLKNWNSNELHQVLYEFVEKCAEILGLKKNICKKCGNFGCFCQKEETT